MCKNHQIFHVKAKIDVLINLPFIILGGEMTFFADDSILYFDYVFEISMNSTEQHDYTMRTKCDYDLVKMITIKLIELGASYGGPHI